MAERLAEDREAPPSAWSAAPGTAGAFKRCARHREVAAAARCDRCRRLWCTWCVRHGEERGVKWLLCECGGRCSAIEPERAPPAPRELLEDAVHYPFRGEGRLLLALGAAFYWVVDLYFGSGVRGMARSISEAMRSPDATTASVIDYLEVVKGASALALVLLCFGYQLSWVAHVIRESARGREEMPAFPEWAGAVESVLAPLGRGLALLAVTLGPGALLLPWGAVGAVLGVLLLAAGAAVLPMALLAVAIADSLEGLEPGRILRSIPRLGAPYLLAAALFAAVVVLLLAGAFWLEQVPLLGPLLRAFLLLYLSAVVGRLLGALYARHAGELGWY
jgi:hypothetical protein